MDFMNYAQTPLVSLAVQFNKNYFGLSPAQPQIMLSAPVAIGGTASHTCRDSRVLMIRWICKRQVLQQY
eukprot:3437-Heterococcus_DN1.PRE.1